MKNMTTNSHVLRYVNVAFSQLLWEWNDLCCYFANIDYPNIYR